MSPNTATKPWWQQATALVTVSTGGVITGLSFAPGAAATMTAPAGLPPVHLMAMEKAASSAGSAETALASDTALRSAIVNVAKYYLQLSKTRTPAQMEALIWGKDSTDGADHGQACAAFASLTLELGAQAIGQESWVTGGSTYPWPVHDWADSRVDPNPGSPGITSMLTDAETHGRWHALGDGYQPQPGDWVLFDQHVEVVTSYSDGVLDTIGADSLPGYTVNAHTFSGSLTSAGIEGFVDNGHLTAAATGAPEPAATGRSTAKQPTPQRAKAQRHAKAQQQQHAKAQRRSQPQPAGAAEIPGTASPQPADAPGSAASGQTPAQPAQPQPTQAQPAQAQPAQAQPARSQATQSQPAQVQTAVAASIPGLDEASASGPASKASAAAGSSVIPGLVSANSSPESGASHHDSTGAGSAQSGSGSAQSGSAGGKYSQHTPHSSAPTPATRAQQAFINSVAPGAMAAQQRWGVPASVTIAQAIEESAWGSSELAAANHNLFGIKGAGPAGSAYYPTQEFEGGHWITINAAFRAYHNDAESISDHAELLATSGYYTRAMADRNVSDAFANDLTGVYATDPDYGSHLIATMQLYDLYRYDAATSSVTRQSAPASHSAPAPGAHATASHPGGQASAHRTSSQQASATPTASIPGVLAAPSAPASAPAPAPAPAPASQTGPANPTPPTRQASKPAARYAAELPSAVTTAYFTAAKTPIGRSEQLYKDVASQSGISWKLIAACDWMQCQAQPRYSPVHGEKLGSVNRDGSVYATKSEALHQTAADMVTLARAVYGIDLTVPRPMSVRQLAEVFAAFRWGGLLKKHGVSAMEFPYSVAGLTDAHLKMQWPSIREPNAPDKPGSKFKQPLGAVPVVLSLKYPATV